MKMKSKPTVNLALQGGGTHGAFTWGILDKFLEDDIFNIEGISATSAGSMNAVVLAQGLMDGGSEGARALLHEFWHEMSEYGKKTGITIKTPMDLLLQPYLHAPANFYLFHAMTGIMSPYQFNPFNYHPIADVLNKMINVEKLKKMSSIKLFICATNVKTGKIRIFNDDDLSVNAVLASACLPQLFQAVEVDGEHYWDGGYLGNPAIFPLIYNTNSADILILHTVPIYRDHIPDNLMDIATRLREISFNSSLMREMRAVSFVTKMIEEGWLKDEYKNKLKKMHIHCLRADKALAEFPSATVYVPDWDFLLTLRDLGRQAATDWINENFKYVGKKTTIDFGEWL